MTQGIRPATRLAWLLLVVVCFGPSAVLAAEDADFAGTWRAKVPSPQGGEVTVVLELAQDSEGGWTGNVRSSQQPDERRDLTGLQASSGRLLFTIEIPEVPGMRQNFQGTLAEDGQSIDGTLEVESPQGNFDLPLNFTKVAVAADAPAADQSDQSPVARFDPTNPVTGRWAAHPSTKEKERELQLELGFDSKGDWAGVMTDTGTDEANVLRDIAMGENTLSFNFRPAGAPFLASFWGRYLPEDDEIRGSLSLGGRSQPISFARVGPVPGASEDVFAEQKTALPRKHFKPFAVTLRGSYWHPLYVLKENVRNINDITTGSWAYDVGFRWYAMDTFAIQGRYVRGGVGFDTNSQNLGLFDPTTDPPGPQSDGIDPKLTRDSFLVMDGFEFTMVGYLGPTMFPTSKFNPYVTGLAGRTKWELTTSGRGSQIITLRDEPVQSTDWTFGGGLGTEYAINQTFGLEFEWMWAYTLTGDASRWSDTTYQWTNQHVFRFSFGLIVWF